MSKIIFYVVKSTESQRVFEKPIETIMGEFEDEEEAEKERLRLYYEQLSTHDKENNWCKIPLARFVVRTRIMK
jgi:hypothetical protein